MTLPVSIVIIGAVFAAIGVIAVGAVVVVLIENNKQGGRWM